MYTLILVVLTGEINQFVCFRIFFMFYVFSLGYCWFWLLMLVQVIDWKDLSPE